MTAIITGAELLCRWLVLSISPTLARLDKELQSLHGEVERIEKKLGNEQGFVAKALPRSLRKRKQSLRRLCRQAR